MTNDYFSSFSALIRATLARAGNVNALFQAVVAAFDKLPTEIELKHGLVTYAVAGGTADVITVTLPYSSVTYVDGMNIRVQAASDNTGPVTINVNGLGAKAVKRVDGEDMIAGDLPEGAIVSLSYNGTAGHFRMDGAPNAVVTAASNAAISAAASAVTASGHASTASSAASTASTQATNASNSAIAAAASAAAMPTPATASTYIKRNAGNSAYEAKTPTEVMSDVGATRTLTAGNGLTGGGTLAADRSLALDVANQAEAEAGLSTSKAMTPQRTAQAFQALSGVRIITDTNQSTSSGTSKTFTAPFANVKRITIIFGSVSGGSTDSLFVRLGTSGGLVTTGYSSTSQLLQGGTSSASVNSTGGFIVYINAAANAITGHMVIDLVSGTSWISSHTGLITTAANVFGSGSVDIGGALTQLGILFSAGASFDSGQINVIWETWP